MTTGKDPFVFRYPAGSFAGALAVLACSGMLCIGVLQPFSAVAQDAAAKPEVQRPDSRGALAYEFVLEGIDDKDIRQEIMKTAQLVTLEKTPLYHRTGLQRRIDSDQENIQIAMRAHGYFGARVSHTIVRGADGVYTVTIAAIPGPVYQIESYRLLWDVQQVDERARGVIDGALAKGRLRLPHGKEVLPDIVRAPQQAVLSLLMQNGYPYPVITRRRLVVNHDTEKVAVAVFMDAGPQAVFGTTRVHGLETLQAGFIHRRVAWKEGEIFDIRKITRTRNDISRSGVIASTEIAYGGPAASPGKKAARLQDGAALPMDLVLTESKHKTIGAGLAYSTSLGPSGNVFWEHRNLFGQAERFRAGLEIGTSISALRATFAKPDLFGKRPLSYQAGFDLKDEKLDAYDRRGINFSNSVAWQASNRLSFSGGVGAEYAEVKEPGKADHSFLLLSFPLGVKYDSSDDLMDPRKGWRLSGGITPYQAMNKGVSFVYSDVSATHYLALGRHFVWANRGKFGAIYGEGLESLPADKRLYAGGGGSVRGYGFQMVGPLDNKGDPTGGRMQLEFNTEMRVKMTETLGMVGFMDAGKVTSDVTAGGQRFLYSAGVGVRYYTIAGPVRFDIAVPLDRRPEDDSFQIYISLGQAF